MNQLLTETSKDNQRKRWARMKELPCSRTFAYKLIRSGDITSVKFIPPGSKKGILLIDQDSLNRYLEKLASEQNTLCRTQDKVAA